MGHSHHHSHDHAEHHHHDHHHHGHHHAHDAPSQFHLAFALAAGLNLTFCLVEAFYAVWANSMGLLADAGHNFGDVLGLLFAWIANMLLSKGANQRYSYGYKKTTILAALANALILVASSAIIIMESVHKFLNPQPINEVIIIVVALVGIAINGGTALLFTRGQEDLNIKAAFLHLAYDALISVGVVIAGFAIYFTGWLQLDPIVALVIVVLILYSTWDLLKSSINLILDAVPANVDHAKVLAYLQSLEGVTAVHDLHIWGLSTRETALTAHLVIPERNLSDEDYHQINHILEHDFKIKHTTLQVERGTHSDPCGQSGTC